MTGLPPIALADVPPIGEAVITLGVFDGVHLGHRAILEATRREAARLGLASVVVVFDPPPDELLRPGAVLPRLAPPRVNVERIEAAGIDRVLLVRFDEALRALTAEQFLGALAPAIRVRGLVMARGSAFGRDRAGTVETLRRHAATHGISILAVDPVTVDGAEVSSTRIRRSIAAGDLMEPRRLGVAPYLEGVVVTGDRRGRELGFPTANLAPGYAPAMPPLGVYAGRVVLAGRNVPERAPALISIGTRPTFHAAGQVLTEVYLLDFDGDLYRLRLGVELVARLRDELRFERVEDLVTQMQRDLVAGRRAIDGS